MKIISIIFLAVTSLSLWAEEKEAWYCAGYIKTVMPKLPDSVTKQRAVTFKIPIKKTIPGDIIFFGKIGRRWGCPNGFSGMVMDVEKGFITFITGVATPKEQVVLFPTKTYIKGNTWYQLQPEIRTFEPETDPPRPGDKNFKPNK